MIIKWKTKKDNSKIERSEFIRETEHTLISLVSSWRSEKPEERRTKKLSEYDKYHDSWQAAHEYLLARASRNVNNYKELLQAARSELGQIESMKEPQEP